MPTLLLAGIRKNVTAAEIVDCAKQPSKASETRMSALIETAIAREDGSNILRDAYGTLRGGGERLRVATERFVDKVSDLANWCGSIPGYPDRQAFGFVIPLVAGSRRGGAQEYAKGDPAVIRVDVARELGRVGGVGADASVHVDARVYRASEFVGIGPAEVRFYFAALASLGLRGHPERAPALLPRADTTEILAGSGESEEGITVAPYIICGVLVLPAMNQIELGSLALLERFRRMLRSETALLPLVRQLRGQIKQVLKGCVHLEHVPMEDRLDRVGEMFDAVLMGAR